MKSAHGVQLLSGKFVSTSILYHTFDNFARLIFVLCGLTGEFLFYIIKAKIIPKGVLDMPINAAFIVPHPPLIVAEVGRGSEKEVQRTIDSYREAARQIASLKPDTIIISSPHAPMYSDCFHISRGEGAQGSFADFRAPQVIMRTLVSRVANSMSSSMTLPPCCDDRSIMAFIRELLPAFV